MGIFVCWGRGGEGAIAEIQGLRGTSMNLVGLWEPVTLFHTLLALEICMWVTNKTGGEGEMPSP